MVGLVECLESNTRAILGFFSELWHFDGLGSCAEDMSSRVHGRNPRLLWGRDRDGSSSEASVGSAKYLCMDPRGEEGAKRDCLGNRGLAGSICGFPWPSLLAHVAG